MKTAFFIGVVSLLISSSSQVLVQAGNTSAGVKASRPFVGNGRKELAREELKGQDPGTSAAKKAGDSKTTESAPTSSSGSSDPVVEAQKNYEAALALYEAGKLDEAIAALKEANRLRPDDPQIQYLLGMAYSQSKDYKEAAESFKRAARSNPNWAEAHFRLGMMNYVLGRRNQSIEAYKKLLELNSPFASTLNRIINDDSNPTSVAESAIVVNKLSGTKPGDPISVPPAPTTSSENRGLSELTRVTFSKAETEKTPATTSPGIDAKPSSKLPVALADSVLTGIYRIGVGDVLDIRLLNSSLNRSSLYTVIDGGLIDMPIAGGAITVAGLTTEEVQTRITAELKRRAVEVGAQVSVGIRLYASHTVIITGLVGSPGTKILRREAVPLYVIMAESQPRLDAARVVIMRAGMAAQGVDLSDSGALNVVIKPGDVINVTTRPQEFYYIAGRVNYPGQKVFQSGITLLQAILAAGGVLRQNDNSVELSREGVDGLLNTTKFNLKEIKAGRLQDPKLRPGDRIEVIN